MPVSPNGADTSLQGRLFATSTQLVSAEERATAERLLISILMTLLLSYPSSKMTANCTRQNRWLLQL